MRQLCILVLIMACSLTFTNCKKAQEKAAPQVVEKSVDTPQEEEPEPIYVNRMKVDSKDAQLKLAAGSENVHSIILKNSIPIRGTQFTLEGTQIISVRTTERTVGYRANFNAKSGGIILVHTSGGKIEPGEGSIAEIVCQKGGLPRLSEIKLAK